MDSNYGAVMTTYDPEDQAERRLMGFSTGRREGQLMSALGQKRTFDPGNAMSALPQKRTSETVMFGAEAPEAWRCSPLFAVSLRVSPQPQPHVRETSVASLYSLWTVGL